jgi:hypothetical protein
MLTVVHDVDGSNDNTGSNRSLLDEIVRDGARQMLAAALEAEVAAYVGQFTDQVDENGHRLVVRNGYHDERTVLTAAGAVPVKAPRVNDRRIDADTGERCRFSSAILPAWARKSPNTRKRSPRSSTTPRCYWSSTGIPPSIGSTFARQIRSKVPLPQYV